MKIITYNVNGIRAAIKKGFAEWLSQTSPDIICLQELKAMEDQLDINIFKQFGYHIYWHPAEKKGYSGVAIFSKQKPKEVVKGCGMEKYDREGRVIRADYENTSVISVYMPSGTSGDERQTFKMEWLADFQEYVNDLKKSRPNLIISGDYNICHKPIDIHDPIRNKKSSGFLPEEREWVDQFVESGFTDSFRQFNINPHQYTWWSYRARAREKNLGWRIDYNMVTNSLEKHLLGSCILPQAKHSDHCPTMVEVNM